MGWLRLDRLQLTDFRSYARLDWRPRARLSVITGPNGSGKTNLLEAASLLQPGRGLRGARMAEFARNAPGASGRWAVAAELSTPAGPATVGTGTPPDGTADRRAFLLNGGPPDTQAEISAVAATAWLTPQMDRLFQEPASGRRRFLDRLVWALEPGHARQVSAYDTAMAGRNRLLAESGADPAWLAGLEDAMARHGVAMAAARHGVAGRLDTVLADGGQGFPAVRFAVECPVAALLRDGPALQAEDWLRDALAAGRGRDAAAGAALTGPHRADMVLTDPTGRRAAESSTGQQKAMLVGVVLAHATLAGASRGAPPLLLLDEPVVHLDLGSRAALFAALVAGHAQAILTGTDAEPFAPLRDLAEGLRTDGTGLAADPWFAPPEGGL